MEKEEVDKKEKIVNPPILPMHKDNIWNIWVEVKQKGDC
jgi:hypothetical protein